MWNIGITGNVVERIFVKAQLGPLPEVLNGTLIVDPDKRASLVQVLEALTV